MKWPEYFMNIAEEVAKKSKDSSTKVGCVIVDDQNRPVSFGFNGFVAGCAEDLMSQVRPLKYHMVIHAEMNALIFAKRDLKDCVVYTTHYPCDNCLKHLLQAGVRKIYYRKIEHVERFSSEQMDACSSLIAATDIKLEKI